MTKQKKNMSKTKNIRFTHELLELIDFYRGDLSYSEFMRLGASTLIGLKQQKMEQEVVSSNQLDNLEKMCRDQKKIRDEKIERDENAEIDELLSQHPESIIVDNKGTKIKSSKLMSIINNTLNKHNL